MFFHLSFFKMSLFMFKFSFLEWLLVGNIISYFSNLFLLPEQSNYFVKLPLHFVHTVIFVKTVLFVETDIFSNCHIILILY